MKTKIIALIMSSLCISTIAHAQSGYPAQPGYQADSGYPAEQGYQASPQEQPKKHKRKNNFSFSVNMPGNETIVVSDHGINNPSNDPQWIRMYTGQSTPHHAVIGGGQPGTTLFVCRANYRGGVHPGKLFQGSCNIGWGGEEVVLNNYEVLSSRHHLHWVRASHGSIPAGAIEGGYQNEGALYICQAEYNGGMHPGKVVGDNCNFGWGGREITVPFYKVLVR